MGLLSLCLMCRGIDKFVKTAGMVAGEDLVSFGLPVTALPLHNKGWTIHLAVAGRGGASSQPAWHAPICSAAALSVTKQSSSMSVCVRGLAF